ncbi:hypothetical protein AYO38_11300 [bacterium SCGC AG-212-C10]|nr:hypothetical protein AYO38_11300 [bacterium SCGC AG-212-C10]
MSESPHLISRDQLPLHGITVVELTNALAGPSCTALLADWGADVVRVESPAHWQPGARGLYARPSEELVKAQKNWTMCYPDWEPGERPYERSAIFANSCRGKRSVALDISRPQGKAAFLRLIAAADVFVENNAPDVPEKLHLTYDDLQPLNPRLVMLQMPAYGHSGPHKYYRSFGNQVEAVTGHAALRGYEGSNAGQLEATFTSDAGAGIMGAFAIVMALTQRTRTGTGRRIELALSEVFLSWLVEPLLQYQLEGVTAATSGNRDRLFAPVGCYRCDGDDAWVNIAVKTDDQWESLVTTIDDLALRNPAFRTNDGRRTAHDEIDAVIADWTKRHTPAEVMRILQAADVPAGAVNTALDVLADPQLRDRGYFQAVEHAETGLRDYPGPAFRTADGIAPIQSGPPLLGEHNEEVLRGLAGLTSAEYEELVALGIVGTTFRAGIP